MSSNRITKKQFTSRAWKYFDILDGQAKSARCRICSKTCSYRTSVTNLVKHVRLVHANAFRGEIDDKSIELDSSPSLSENEEETEEIEVINNEDDEDNNGNTEEQKDTKSVEVLESVEEMDSKTEVESVCLLCHKTFPDQDSALMMNHMLKVHNITQIKLVDGSIHFEQAENDPTSSSPRQRLNGKRSCSWDYFSVKDKVAKVAECNLCEGVFSYRSTVSNLIKHLVRKHSIHPMRNKDEYTTDEGEKTLNHSTSSGPRRNQRSSVWSFFNSANEEGTVVECARCHDRFNAVGNGVRNMKKHMLVKHPEALYRHTKSGDPLFVSTTNDDMSEDEDYLHEEYLDLDFDEQEKTSPKPKLVRTTSFERRTSGERSAKRPRIYRNSFQTQNNSTKPPESLECFSNYVTSLLQELPDRVSKRLQLNFVKQVLEAQISCADNDINVSGMAGNCDVSVTIDRSVGDSDVDAGNIESSARVANGIVLGPVEVQDRAGAY